MPPPSGSSLGDSSLNDSDDESILGADVPTGDATLGDIDFDLPNKKKGPKSTVAGAVDSAAS